MSGPERSNSPLVQAPSPAPACAPIVSAILPDRLEKTACETAPAIAGNLLKDSLEGMSRFSTYLKNLSQPLPGNRELAVAAALATTSRGVFGAVSQIMKDQETRTTRAAVNFAHGEAALSPESRAELDGIISSVKGRDVQSLRVVGYTDTSGSAESNDRLSIARADAVTSYLENGLARNGSIVRELSRAGRGEERTPQMVSAVYPESSRRVDIELIAAREPLPGVERPRNEPAPTQQRIPMIGSAPKLPGTDGQ